MTMGRKVRCQKQQLKEDKFQYELAISCLRPRLVICPVVRKRKKRGLGPPQQKKMVIWLLVGFLLFSVVWM